MNLELGKFNMKQFSFNPNKNKGPLSLIAEWGTLVIVMLDANRIQKLILLSD